MTHNAPPLCAGVNAGGVMSTNTNSQADKNRNITRNLRLSKMAVSGGALKN